MTGDPYLDKPTIINCPPIPRELLDYLRQQFRDRAPREPYLDREPAIASGQQAVIDHLIAVYRRQNTIQH